MWGKAYLTLSVVQKVRKLKGPVKKKSRGSGDSPSVISVLVIVGINAWI